MSSIKTHSPLRGGGLPLAITYVVLIVVSIIMFLQARAFPASHMGPASPGFFPQVVAAIILVLCLLGLLELRLERLPPVHFPARVVLAMVASVLYVGVMYVVGYYPSSFLFSVFVMWLVRGHASMFRIAFDSLVLVVVSYLLFNVMIGATLPLGMFFE